jgi:hypothetical protein
MPFAQTLTIEQVGRDREIRARNDMAATKKKELGERRMDQRLI